MIDDPQEATNVANSLLAEKYEPRAISGLKDEDIKDLQDSEGKCFARGTRVALRDAAEHLRRTFKK